MNTTAGIFRRFTLAGFCKPFVKALSVIETTVVLLRRGDDRRNHNFMKELKSDHKSHGDPNGGPIHQGQPPYWRRAHRDWRIWFCVIVMLFAMVVYLMTGDLRWPFHGHPQAMVPIAN